MKRNEDINTDWHPADIKAALEKRDLTFRQLSVQAGYSKDSLKSVLRTPCRPYQQIVADALGVQPEVIWPSRYQAKGCFNRGV
ncbi:transcriptional regulator [Leminorella grimontii]|uniref:DNA-binding transcriptional regulator Nlp n=2 Tax=Leminorella TaxID=82980 RepID=A0A2X4U5G2_9GAMM|nr:MULTISPECIES: helix-turn-helix domain-containing protein [Leminorella]KFC98405.1 DNA-binding repressor [Leminorella grimontii ATCC 33999 = DSM 5078]GKX57251.1 transcriptional regulator [Leminorella grimontii]SQI35016.1 DNA-binding transcriptional regulator Nlp [Leminorella richardii]VFS55881.1 DNA-binding transcriptional regulator Nlp [Leminorella grimontii]